jgi:hypothetical protein
MIHGKLVIDVRSSYVSVETCPMHVDSEVTDEIYGTTVTEYTFEYGSYSDTSTVAAENVGDSESCPTFEGSTTFDPEYNEPDGYGDIISSTTTYSSPVTRSTVRGDLPAIDWSEWSSSGLSYESSNGGLFGHLYNYDAVIYASTNQAVSGSSSIGSTGTIIASRSDAEVRFRIHTPLACTVVYQIGSQYTPLYGDDEWEEEVTWGGEMTVIVTEETIVTLPVAEDFTKSIRLRRIIWHPWT